MMKTDIRETENQFELDIDLPGFKKEDVNLELKNGYLTISADKALDKDEKDDKGRTSGQSAGAARPAGASTLAMR